MAEPPFRISLIVATRNRAHKLKACLAAIARIRFAEPWELVVADNGSTDDTAKIVEAFAGRVSFPVRYVHESAPGNSNARNAGIRVSAGEILAFTDDDCYVSPDLLAHLDRIFEDPAIGFASGQILMHDPTAFPLGTINDTTPKTIPPNSFVPAGIVGGGNMAFRRTAALQAGAFDPRFGSGSVFAGEECDLAARVSLLGWTGRYCPELVVEHHHEAPSKEAVSRFYDKGRGAYHTKLLLEGKSMRLFLKGWLGLRWRIWDRPSTVWWELVGAAQYVGITLGRGR